MNIYQEILDMQRRGESGALCTIIESKGAVPRHAGSKMLVFESGRIAGSVGGGEIESRVIEDAFMAMNDGKIHKVQYSLVDPARGDPGVCGGQVEVMVEPILAPETILIIGGGHVGRTITHLAKWLGYRVVLSDDRPEFCTPETVPEADEYLCCAMKEVPERMAIREHTWVILATRGVAVDTPGLPAILETKASFVGIIGSRKRWLTTRKNLLEQGIPAEKLDRVVSPIGLELKAETPEEIAVSILAEILMLRNQASGARMMMVKKNE